jgi:hypothetical protein
MSTSSTIEDQYLTMKYGTKSPDDFLNVPWINSNMCVAAGCSSSKNYSLYLVTSVSEPPPPMCNGHISWKSKNPYPHYATHDFTILGFSENPSNLTKEEQLLGFGVGYVLYSLHVCVCGCIRYENYAFPGGGRYALP